MNTIWKFPVEPDAFSVEMPAGAKVLSVQLQGEFVQMWALVDPSRPTETRRFITLATGRPTSAGLGAFVGTFQLPGGSLVFHLFEAA